MTALVPLTSPVALAVSALPGSGVTKLKPSLPIAALGWMTQRLPTITRSPIRVPAWISVPSPMSASAPIVTLESRATPSPITAFGPIETKGPIETSFPILAVGSMTDIGWMPVVRWAGRSKRSLTPAIA